MPKGLHQFMIALAVLLSGATLCHAQENSEEDGAGSTVHSAAELSWSDDDHEDYLTKIQALYRDSSPSEALVEHINNLLEFYSHGDRRIIAASRLATPSHHRIHLSDQGEIITQTLLGQSARHNRFSVFGVNPYLRYDCGGSYASCWVIHPVTDEPWLQIVENPEAGRELTKALAELIKQLQAS